MHIRAYLLILAAGILIPALLLSGLAFRMLQQAEQRAALGALGESANGVALLVDRELYSAEAALRVLAASPSLAARDDRAYYEQAKRVHAGDDGWSLLLDADGQALVNTAVPFGTPLGAMLDQASTRAMIKAGRTVVSDLLPAGVDGKRSTTMSLPVTLANGNSYVLVKAFSTDRRGGLEHASLEGTRVFDVFTHPSMSGWAVAVAAPVALLGRCSRDASVVAAMGLLAATLVAVALAGWFGRRHVRSIRRAVQAAIGLGKGVQPAVVRSRVIELNELHAALQAAGEQLLQAHAFRQHADSERQSLLEGEQQARLVAEQQNSAKDQFLAMLGHELRNPLAPISTAAQLLKLQTPDAARVRYASDVIARQVDHMNSLPGDLLDVSRVTRGLVVLNMEPVELGPVIERALEQTGELVLEKKQSLVLDMPRTPMLVRGDKTRLIQIFTNLINNAAKYSPPGGQIGVKVRAGDGELSVVVTDNGEGIAQDLLPRIFDLFSQGERAPDRSPGGLGLGLALVQSLVRMRGGSVTACSAGAGQGSTFAVVLPYSVQAAPARTAAASTGPVARTAPGHLAIMIVDDNIDGAISLSLFLEDAGGHRVSTYYDAGTALGSAAAESPDVFILDIGLPDITGYELARRLRSMPQCKDALYIALTGYGQAKDKKLAFEAGFDHHVSKPADPQAILSLLGEVRRHA
ncbi:ATP-binding protein [Massilia sp. TWP1-3-3]|uniref:hybrid sensor histidine kinase/response regulator n=1 Tax=Massilia sp. TWP1-3-3 TaxID=2804573 RepID=UPI003CEF4DAE